MNDIVAKKRWTAEITYIGGLEAEARFEEIKDLHDLVERGPNFYAVERIVIRLNDPDPALVADALPEVADYIGAND